MVIYPNLLCARDGYLSPPPPCKIDKNNEKILPTRFSSHEQLLKKDQEWVRNRNLFVGCMRHWGNTGGDLIYSVPLQLTHSHSPGTIRGSQGCWRPGGWVLLEQQMHPCTSDLQLHTARPTPWPLCPLSFSSKTIQDLSLPLSRPSKDWSWHSGASLIQDNLIS